MVFLRFNDACWVAAVVGWDAWLGVRPSGIGEWPRRSQGDS